MAQRAVSKRKIGGVRTFIGGCDSFSEPTDIAEDQCAWLYNCITSGGPAGTRPPFKVILRLGCGKPQGFTHFRPTNGPMLKVFAVSGSVYYSVGPSFSAVVQLAGISFDPLVDHIVFEEAVVAVDEFGNAITPYAVLMMQDGKNRAAYFDGSTARHLDPTPDGYVSPSSIGGKETPIGLWMKWIGNRLWVASKRQIFASDIFNPLKFIESQYLASGGSFQAMDGDIITGMAKTADNKQLLVFTQKNTTSIFASNTDRSSWSSTPDFVSLWFPGVGCVAGKSPFVHNGELHWMSAEGWRMYNQVGSTMRTSKVSIASHEMERSFKNMSPMTWRACGGSRGHFAMMSVPSGDSLNHHTWVMDTSSSDLLRSQRPYSWQGVWTGTRPVEWSTASIDGVMRCFFLSADYDGFVRIWEAFADGIDDQGGQIQAFVDGRGENFEEELNFKNFSHAELFFDSIRGRVNMDTFFKNNYGCFEEMGSFELCAENCMQLNTAECTLPKNLDPQSRYRNLNEKTFTCDPVAPLGSLGGLYFTPRFSWSGKASIHGYKMHGDQAEETTVGDCAGDDESCPKLECCDQEPDYRSIDETPDYYYYGGVNDCEIVAV